MEVSQMEAKWKIPNPLGFSALIDFVKQTRKTSDVNASGVSDLQTDLQGLAERTTQTFGEVDTALATLDDEKLDKTNAVAASIPVSGWKSDASVAAYPKYYDLTATGVTDKDRVAVYIAPASVQMAISCGVCPTCETLAGKIRIRAAQVPTSAIKVQYWIEKGKA